MRGDESRCLTPVSEGLVPDIRSVIRTLSGKCDFARHSRNLNLAQVFSCHPASIYTMVYRIFGIK